MHKTLYFHCREEKQDLKYEEVLFCKVIGRKTISIYPHIVHIYIYNYVLLQTGTGVHIYNHSIHKTKALGLPQIHYEPEIHNVIRAGLRNKLFYYNNKPLINNNKSNNNINQHFVEY